VLGTQPDFSPRAWDPTPKKAKQTPISSTQVRRRGFGLKFLRIPSRQGNRDVSARIRGLFFIRLVCYDSRVCHVMISFLCGFV
jgi:hypothetical protein